MGIHTIGDLAQTPLTDLKRFMRMRFGKNSDIAAEVYWRTANGLDDSAVTPSTHDKQQAVGHGMTLPRDYEVLEEIQVVLLELAEEVCRRSRFKGYMGRVVSVGAQGADFDRPTGFYRQTTLPDSTNITREVYQAANRLFAEHWDGLPVRKVSVTLSGMTGDQEYQLTLFGDREKIRSLERTTDEIKQKYGYTAILRASSMLQAGQAKERSMKIGGHYK
jgi:DNA polymerase-4